MMEETNAREGHRHSVFIAGFYHIIIAHAATSLCHVLHTALVGALNIVAEGEEGIRTQADILLLRNPFLLFIVCYVYILPI